MMAKKEVEKWRAPVMESDPSRVIRYREENEASIPTAKDIDQWRAQAEEEGFEQEFSKNSIFVFREKDSPF